MTDDEIDALREEMGKQRAEIREYPLSRGVDVDDSVHDGETDTADSDRRSGASPGTSDRRFPDIYTRTLFAQAVPSQNRRVTSRTR